VIKASLGSPTNSIKYFFLKKKFKIRTKTPKKLGNLTIKTFDSFIFLIISRILENKNLVKIEEKFTPITGVNITLELDILLNSAPLLFFTTLDITTISDLKTLYRENTSLVNLPSE